jgi:hypothetical protein
VSSYWVRVQYTVGFHQGSRSERFEWVVGEKLAADVVLEVVDGYRPCGVLAELRMCPLGFLVVGGAGRGCLWWEGEGRVVEDGLVPDGLLLEVVGAQQPGDLLVDLGGDPSNHYTATTATRVRVASEISGRAPSNNKQPILDTSREQTSVWP